MAWLSGPGKSRRYSCPGLTKLQTVAERVVDEEAIDIRDPVVVLERHAGRPESRPNPAEVVGDESRVRLPRRGERLLDAEVEFLRSSAEPHPASRPDRLGLRDLLETEQSPVERARLVLDSPRHGHLHV